jgi:hypothetical protein
MNRGGQREISLVDGVPPDRISSEFRDLVPSSYLNYIIIGMLWTF